MVGLTGFEEYVKISWEVMGVKNSANGAVNWQLAILREY